MTTLLEFNRSLHQVPLQIRGYLNLLEHLYSEFHGRQFRDTGEPYIEHIVDVMRQVIEFEKECSLEIDWAAVIAAGGHDLIEDTYGQENRVTPEILEKAFGQEDHLFGHRIAFLIEAVSKKPKEEFPDKQARLTEYHGRLVAGIMREPKIVVLKLCDRLHNLSTLHGLSECDPSKQQRVALETIEFYVPLVNGDIRTVLPIAYLPWLDRMAHQLKCLALAYLGDKYTVEYYPISYNRSPVLNRQACPSNF